MPPSIFLRKLFPVGVFLVAPFTFATAQPTVPATAISLPDLVAEILAQNPERQFYREELAAVHADATVAARWDDPELAVDVGHKRLRDSAGTITGEGTAWSVAVSQTFPWPGRTSLRKAIANRDIALAETGLARFENALAARARGLAFGLHAAQARAAATREVADRFAALKATFLARDPAGLTPLLETRVIEAAELSLQRRAADAELAVQSALLELNQLRGTAPDAPLRVAARAVILADAPASADLLAAARAHNFEFALRRIELEQQGYRVELAQNERYPGITVSPFYSSAEAGERETVVGLGLSLPIPVSGRATANITSAQARERQARTALVVAQRELDRQVLVAAQTYAVRLREVRAWADDATTKFGESAALADRHYRLGAVPISTYLELQTSYLEATDTLLATRADALAAALELEQLTGTDLNLISLQP